MENQNNITGAVRRYAGFSNNTLAAILLGIPANQIGIANDRKCLVHSDNEGNPVKTMSGEATDDDNFTFTSTAIKLPLPFTFELGNQTTVGSKRIRITDSGVFFEVYDGVTPWAEMGAFF